MKIKQIREPFNAISHFFAAIAAAGGSIYLILQNLSDLKVWVAFLLYGLSLVMLFLASAIYHSSNGNDQTLLRLRKFDHAAIYFLIAGSYTPICIYFFQGFWQWGLLTIIWILAVVGVAVKMFIIRAPRWVTAGVYLIMGWLSIVGVEEIIARMPLGAIIWLVAGGLFYTIGAIIYMTKKLNLIPGVFGFHEIWHLFVIFGAFSHFMIMIQYINP